MATDRKHKKKLKRKEKQAAQRREKHHAARQWRLEELLADLRARMNWGRDYENAFALAMKILKLAPSNVEVFQNALFCVTKINDDRLVLAALSHGWHHRLIDHKQNLLALIQLALDAGNTDLAAKVVEELETNGQAYRGRLTRDKKMALGILKNQIDWQVQKSAARKNASPSRPTETGRPKTPAAAPKRAPASTSTSAQHEKLPLEPAATDTAQADSPLLIQVEVEPQPLLEVLAAGTAATKETLDLTLEAYQVAFQATYDELLCLPHLRGVEAFWYQQETARKVMKQFRGRAILADEVGLGKTIEASLVVKEYMVRSLVKTALILVPSALVNQWQEELWEKFGLSFVSTNDDLFRRNPETFWRQPLILASIQTARTKKHIKTVTERFYDMVVVDEAHHLKNHTTVNWKLVNALQKTFLLLLTATPVQNKLEELYNLVTLLKPGHLQTRKAFKAQFIARGNPADPVNREHLRGLLREVMIRNTRSVAQVQLPPRFATTVKVEPEPAEETFYTELSNYVREEMERAENALVKFRLRRLLEAAGSSLAAGMGALRTLAENGRSRHDGANRLLEQAQALGDSAKAGQVADIIQAGGDKVLVFVNYRATLDYLHRVFAHREIPHAVFQGGMSNDQKQQAVAEFRDGCQVLLATGTGGEGHNLQFCHTLINYDLPWNPMEIEQRIGRIHRIGQKNPVQVYNFCAGGSIEERILDVLDRKINMFELVIGEIDMILGRLRGEKEFADLVFELWLQNRDEPARNKAFDDLAARLKRARTAHDKTKALDETLFQDDFGM